MKIPSALQNWNGIEYLESELYARGFQMHHKCLKFCALRRNIPYELLHKDLSGDSLSYIRSGFVAKNPFDPKLDLDPNSPASFYYLRNKWFSEEIHIDRRYLEDWDYRASHIRNVAKRIAKDRGHMLSRKGFVISKSKNIYFDIEVDIGRPGSERKSTIFLKRLIICDDNWSKLLEWGYLLGGYYYPQSNTPEEIIYSVEAQITTAELFLESFTNMT